MKTGFSVITIVLFTVFVFSNCSNKKYGYTYFEEGVDLNTVKAVPFKPNDFDINFRLALDSVILDKEKPSPLFVDVKISGQHQYWPKDLKIEIYCNDKRILIKDTEKKFSVSSVINARVKYFSVNLSEFNIPEVIDKLKNEHNIPDSVNYFKVTSGLDSEYFVSDSNPEKITVKLKASWNGGSEITEKTFILTKIDITKYRVQPRFYG